MRKFCIVLIIFLLIVYLLYPINSFQIRSIDKVGKNQLLYHTIVNPGDKFSVEWIHSISKQPVTETYKITDNLKIEIYEMIFNTNSPNLPAFPEGETKWEIKDGIYRVYNYNVVLDELLITIGMVISNHTLFLKDEVFVLKELYRPGGLVKVEIKKVPMILYLWEGIQICLKKKNTV